MLPYLIMILYHSLPKFTQILILLTILEYNVDLDNGNYIQIRQRKINHRIIDLDATEDFVIVQGVNQHQILFSNGYDYVMVHHQDQIFKHMGLRDFVFFNQSYKLENMGDTIIQEILLQFGINKKIKKNTLFKCITKEYQYDDFFFGITASSAFLTRFQIEPIKMKCLYYQTDVGQSFTYTLQYNTTKENVQGLVVRHTQNVNVEIVQTYFYEAEYYLIYSMVFLLVSMLIMGFGYVGIWFQNYKRQYQVLIEQIEKSARDRGIKQQINGSATLKGDDTSVFQQQNKSIVP